MDVPGRQPIVVQDPIIPEIGGNDPDQTTSIVDKVEPGRNVFAGEEVKNIESKQPVEPIRPEEEPKEISSVFKTELSGMGKNVEKQPDHVLLPDENAATTRSTAPSVAASSSTSGTSSASTASTSTSLAPSAKTPSDEQSTESTTTSTVAKQPPAANRPAGPIDHADAEEERVRQELFPEAAAGKA